MYLNALILSLTEYGYDPRNALKTLLKTIQKNYELIDDVILNYMLIITSQIIHNISPFYLRSAVAIIEVKFENFN